MKKVIPFNQLSKAKQRVEIAKDVLKQLGLRKYIPQCMVYINPNVKKELEGDIYSMEMDKLVAENKVTCNVCVKGALFMSHVMKTDNCTYYEAKRAEDSDIINRLDMFSDAQIAQIEKAFEGWVERDSKSKLAKFVRRNKNEGRRMVLIMKNIIRNKGTFKL